MAVQGRVGGAARAVGSLYARVGGVSRAISAGYVRVGGVSRQVYQNKVVIFENGAFPSSMGAMTGAWAQNVGVFTVGTGAITYTRASEPACICCLYATQNPFAFTPGAFKTLSFQWQGSTPYSGAGIHGAVLFGLAASRAPVPDTGYTFPGALVAKLVVWTGYTWGDISGGTAALNVSGLSGSYYFVFGAMNYQQTMSVTLSSPIVLT